MNLGTDLLGCGTGGWDFSGFGEGLSESLSLPLLGFFFLFVLFAVLVVSVMVWPIFAVKAIGSAPAAGSVADASVETDPIQS